MNDMTHEQIEWIVSVTTQKLQEGLKLKKLSEAEYNAELTKLTMWAEKTFKEIEMESFSEINDDFID